VREEENKKRPRSQKSSETRHQQSGRSVLPVSPLEVLRTRCTAVIANTTPLLSGEKE